MTTVAYGETLIAPSVAPTIVQGSATGNLTGSYQYEVTFTDTYGESLPSSASSPVTITGQASVSAIPLGPPYCSSRKLYRTVASGTVYKLLTTIADNLTTTYTDNTADGSLGTANPPTIPEGESIQKVIGYNILAQPMIASISASVVAVTSGTQPVINTQETIIATSPSGGQVTLMPLFSASLVGTVLRLRNNGANPCLLNPSSGQTINGGASLALANGAYVVLFASSATNWQQISP